MNYFWAFVTGGRLPVEGRRVFDGHALPPFLF